MRDGIVVSRLQKVVSVGGMFWMSIHEEPVVHSTDCKSRLNIRIIFFILPYPLAYELLSMTSLEVGSSAEVVWFLAGHLEQEIEKRPDRLPAGI